MRRRPDPLRRLPTPPEVYDYLGRLYRELRLARRLYKLSQAAARDVTPPTRPTGEVSRG